ncbi:MAG: hypothetical protein JO190_03365 [Candidatus Eremiobacteraeota bacterium]|nr:hypothetical protein [Candidatus Eremiobacteraeota bacterium]
MRKLLVIRRRMLPKVMPATRSATAAAARLAHIVIEALFYVGAMFRLQKSISL